MKRLGLSLLLLVVLATIGTGWALDKLFGHVGPVPVSPLQTYSELGQTLAAALDRQEPLQLDRIGRNNPAGQSIWLMPESDLPLPDALLTSLTHNEPLVLESEKGLAMYFAIPNHAYILGLQVPGTTQRHASLRLLFTILFYSAVIALILLWLYPLTRRLQRLTKGVQGFGQGELEHRVETHPGSQLHTIEREFNQMAQRIQDLVQDNRLLSSAVSHDLKTPLSRLRFGVDVLEETREPAVIAEYLQRLSQDVHEMETLVAVLLDYARLDRQLYELPMSSLDLHRIIDDCVAVCSPAHQARIVWADETAQLSVRGHAGSLAMLVNNLLHNALRYGRHRVHLRTGIEHHKPWFGIEDDGPGIEPTALPRLMKPFERSMDPDERSAAHSPPGHGMGLAIVQRIVLAHEAELRCTVGQILGGARFTVSFPPVT